MPAKKHARRGPVPARAARRRRGGVAPFKPQKHGAQQRRDRRRRRDRPCAGIAGDRGRRRCADRLQSGAAQADERFAAAPGHHPRSTRTRISMRGAYHEYKSVAFRGRAWRPMRAAQGRAFDSIIVEGAGQSPPKVNLRGGATLRNMGFAERVDCPVVLVADIDRGGVFAQFWSARWRACRKSERGRAHPRLRDQPVFAAISACCNPGSTGFAARTGKPGARRRALSPRALTLDAGGHAAKREAQRAAPRDALKVIVPAPATHQQSHGFRCAGARTPQVDFQYVRAGDRAAAGRPDRAARFRKSVQRDLAWLRDHGWGSRDRAASALRRQAARHLRWNADARARHRRSRRHRRSGGGGSTGWGLLDLSTTLHAAQAARKTSPADLRLGRDGQRAPRARFTKSTWDARGGAALARAGRAARWRAAGRRRFRTTARSRRRICTASSIRRKACAALLEWGGASGKAEALDYPALREASLDRLADALAESLDLDAVGAAFG